MIILALECILISNIAIGNLWSVTDRDADLLTIEFLKKLTFKRIEEKNNTIKTDILISSKDVQSYAY